MNQRNCITADNSSTRQKLQQNPSYFVVSPVANGAPPPSFLSARSGGYMGRFQLIYPDSQQSVPLSHYVNGPPATILLPTEQQTKFASVHSKPLPKLSHQQPPNNTNTNKRPAEHVVNEKYKTTLCKSFTLSGFCAYGSQCLFAHGESELRNQNFKKCW